MANFDFDFKTLPGRFGHARDKCLVRQFAEADPTDAELTHISMRTPTELATIVAAHRKFRFQLGFLYQAFFSHKVPLNFFGAWKQV